MRNPLKPKSKRRQFVELQDDPGFSAEQFIAPDPPSKIHTYIQRAVREQRRAKSITAAIVPWKAIGLALLLFTAGSVLITVGALIKLGYITSEVKGK